MWLSIASLTASDTLTPSTSAMNSIVFGLFGFKSKCHCFLCACHHALQRLVSFTIPSNELGMSRRHATTVSHWSEPLPASCRLRGFQRTHRHVEQPVQFLIADLAVVDDADRDERALDHAHCQVDVEVGVDLTPGHRPLNVSTVGPRGPTRRRRNSSRLAGSSMARATIHTNSSRALLRSRHLEVGPVDLGEVAAERPASGGDSAATFACTVANTNASVPPKWRYSVVLAGAAGHLLGGHCTHPFGRQDLRGGRHQLGSCVLTAGTGHIETQRSAWRSRDPLGRGSSGLIVTIRCVTCLSSVRFLQ